MRERRVGERCAGGRCVGGDRCAGGGRSLGLLMAPNGFPRSPALGRPRSVAAAGPVGSSEGRNVWHGSSSFVIALALFHRYRNVRFWSLVVVDGSRFAGNGIAPAVQRRRERVGSAIMHVVGTGGRDRMRGGWCAGLGNGGVRVSALWYRGGGDSRCPGFNTTQSSGN